MKGDFSRQTFDRTRHYSSVRMQQGRVQLDADWNEQSAITNYRAETGLLDVVGGCGGPVRYAGFRLVASAADLTAAEKAMPQNDKPPSKLEPGDLLITGGRYYVEGSLAENESIVQLSKQPDLPPLPGTTPFAKSGLYLAYLDVWERHITALDDPSIREVALGGPDTTTRSRTVWQVKLWYSGGKGPGGCKDPFPDFDKEIAPGTGRLSARTKPAGPNVDPCIVPPGAGFRGLENQLYRVEIHTPGGALDLAGGTPVTVNAVTITPAGVVQLTLASKVTWAKGDAFEIFPTASGSDPMAGTLAFLDTIDGTGKIITLGGGTGGLTVADALKVRRVEASYKWSRDNGSVVTTIEKIDGAEITVHDLGPDTVLGFAPEQWVELSDDVLELNGLPGRLAQIKSIDPGKRMITLKAPVDVLAGNPNGVDPVRHPKLRRWDGVGAIKVNAPLPSDGAADLEDGIQVRFTDGTYRTGDYWTVPARTATSEQSGNIEWPVAPGTTNPAELLPFGIRHRYCRIAVVNWDADAKSVTIEDCRCLFSPLTRLSGLFYVGGDGQEAMPGFAMPQPLQVGLFNVGMLNNCAPVAGSSIRFTTIAGGRLALTAAGLPGASNSIIVPTGPDGIAGVAWQMDPDISKRNQTVEARLLNAEGVPLPQVVFFHGNLSIAGEVAYDPKECTNLAGVKTVEEALDEICKKLGQSGNCHPFLDELRSDGVVRDRDGTLGLQVLRSADSENEEEPAFLKYLPGVAYVGGCRHDISKGGTIAVDRSTIGQWVVVNATGDIEVILEPLPPPHMALLALVSTINGRVERIVDMRRDMTHLDEQVEENRHGVATSRKDAREYVPLLAGTLSDLRYRDSFGIHGYRDGRNHTFDTDSLAPSLVFDGRSIWVPLFQQQAVLRFDRYATEIADGEIIPTDRRLLAGAFDGTCVWFTSPFVTASNPGGAVLAINTATLETRRVDIPGLPVVIMFDGHYIWVTTSDTLLLVQIDVNRNEIVRTLSLNTAGSPTGLQIRPLALEFDGENIWVSGTSRTLFRIQKPWGDPEPVQVTTLPGIPPSDFFHFAFDGSHLWMVQQDGQVFRMDTLTGKSRLAPIQFRSQLIRGVIFDGMFLWFMIDDQESGKGLLKVDPRTSQQYGEMELPRLPFTIPTLPLRQAVCDGTHYWYPCRPATANEPDDKDQTSFGFQKLLIA